MEGASCSVDYINVHPQCLWPFYHQECGLEETPGEITVKTLGKTYGQVCDLKKGRKTREFSFHGKMKCSLHLNGSDIHSAFTSFSCLTGLLINFQSSVLRRELFFFLVKWQSYEW